MDALPSPTSFAMRALIDRGCVHQATDASALDAAFSSGVVTAYAGFDATADSLHVGHMLPLMTLRRLQQAGHKPIVLVGGGTTQIGDPSFRSASRPMLSVGEITRNVASIRRCFGRFLTFGEGPTDAVLVDNADWLGALGYLEVLRDVGRHVSVNRMLTLDSVRTRLDSQEGLSFLEFNYAILQAYDFVELGRRFGCRLQVGGSDQWGNIVGGVDLVRRIDGGQAFGLTSPLLQTASGQKMGKTADGAVWLNADRLPPFDFWQFWRNVEDGDVGRFLRLFTDLDEEVIIGLERLRDAAVNLAKIRLATEVTTMVHGQDAAMAAAEAARGAFQGSGDQNGLPEVLVVPDARGGVGIIDALIAAGFADSRSAARRLVEGGGARIDGVLASLDSQVLASALDNGPVRLSSGKKRHTLLRSV